MVYTRGNLLYRPSIRAAPPVPGRPCHPTWVDGTKVGPFQKFFYYLIYRLLNFHFMNYVPVPVFIYLSS